MAVTEQLKGELLIGPLQILGDGKEENAYRPKLPSDLKGELSDYVDWGAWYYPAKPPYQYCMVNIFKTHKDLPLKIKSAEISIEECKVTYPDYYESLVSSKQVVGLDPAPESWNFDADITGNVPVGWTVFTGTMTVEENQFVSSPKSFEADGSASAGAYAGASRTDMEVESQVRSSGAFSTGGNIFRYVDASNFYHARLHVDSQAVQLYKVVAAAWTQLATVSFTVNQNTWYKVKSIVSGWNAQVHVDDAQILPASGWQTLTGSDHASGVIGVRGFGANSYWFDDVNVQDYAVGISIPVAMHHYGHHISKIIRG